MNSSNSSRLTSIRVSINHKFTLRDGSHIKDIKRFLQTSPHVFADTLEMLSQLSHIPCKQSLNTVKASLPYAFVNQLREFLKTSPNTKELLTTDIRMEALNLAIKKCNRSWIDIIDDVFEINQIDGQTLIATINGLLAEHRYYESALLVVRIKLHKHFDIQQIAVPLVLQDKLTLADDYIRCEPNTYGFQLIGVFDRLYVDSAFAEDLRRRIPDTKADKLMPKLIQKYVYRLLKQYNISESSCPNIIHNRNVKQLRYLLYKKYVEGGLSEGSFAEMVEQCVGDDKSLREELIKELVCNGDYNEAIKWANLYRIPTHKRPHAIRNISEVADTWSYVKDDDSENYYKLKLSIVDDIYFVNSGAKFERFINHIRTSGVDVIGMDAEWKPIMGNSSSSAVQRMSILQVATRDSCYILDIPKLTPSKKCWREFVDGVLNSEKIIKLGYSFQNDMTVLKDTVLRDMGLAAELKPKRVIDLLKFTDLLLSEFPDIVDEWSIANAQKQELKGLSKTVFLFLGKPLNKSEQFSDWERRPLREAQIIYAALDSVCLIDIYRKIEQYFVANDSNFAAFIEKFLAGKIMKPKLQLTKDDGHSDVAFPQTRVKQFRCVVDTMLQGLGRYLRICGADVHILETNDNHHKAARVAVNEGRVLLTCGQPYDQLKQHVPNGMCYRVNNNQSAYQQMQTVLLRYNVIVAVEDLFTRCPKCNCDAFAEMTRSDMKRMYQCHNPMLDNGVKVKFEGFHVSVFDKVNQFLICSRCGQVFWDGCHQDRWKQKISEILFNVSYKATDETVEVIRTTNSSSTSKEQPKRQEISVIKEVVKYTKSEEKVEELFDWPTTSGSSVNNSNANDKQYRIDESDDNEDDDYLDYNDFDN